MCMGFRKCQARKTNTTSNIYTQHTTRHKIVTNVSDVWGNGR